MTLPIEPPLPPMEARTADALPEGDGWQYEPKWDGFRCLVFRDGAEVQLQSKSCKPLARYFPEVVEAVRTLRSRAFVLDAELVVPVDGRLSFDALLQRIHPAASRIEKLSRETPASLIVFDQLAAGEKTPMIERPLEDRRAYLEGFAERFFDDAPSIHLSPVTRELDLARRWLLELEGVDGVVAKRVDQTYRSGERAMTKVKRLRTADCVVGGFRYSKNAGVGSLLLGLYGPDGLLHHVGFCSSFTRRQKEELEPLLESHRGPPGFTGSAPGGPSRWSSAEEREWESLDGELVVEVQYDHFTNDRFRHGTTFQRWRPDKAPRQCTFDQIEVEGVNALGDLG